MFVWQGFSFALVIYIVLLHSDTVEDLSKFV